MNWLTKQSSSGPIRSLTRSSTAGSSTSALKMGSRCSRKTLPTLSSGFRASGLGFFSGSTKTFGTLCPAAFMRQISTTRACIARQDSIGAKPRMMKNPFSSQSRLRSIDSIERLDGIRDGGVGEEFRIRLQVKLRGIRENEVAIIRVAQKPLVHQPMALEQHGRNIGHVPMADVGRKNRLQPSTHWIGARVERAMDAQVISLAAEVEVAENSREVVLLAHSGQRPFVAIGRAIVTLEAFVVGPHRARRVLRDKFGTAVLGEQLMQARAIEPRRIVIHQTRTVALFPMLFERVEQVAGPSRAALEKSERQLREPRRDSAHHDRAAQLALLIGVRADVVEHVVGRRAPPKRQVAQTDAAMRSDRDFQLDEFAPHQVVIEEAVEPVTVEIRRVGKCTRMLAFERGNRARHARRNHRDLQAKDRKST